MLAGLQSNLRLQSDKEIENPLRKSSILDKLIDELAKERPLEKILRLNRR